MSSIKELEKEIQRLKKDLKQERKNHLFTQERLTGSYDRNFSLRTGLINLTIDEIITMKNKQKELQQNNLND
jgi:hypothetical protein